ncbi:TrmH family RNA methyltransferase [Azonexus sp.]|uniref:TrmH family RNA methyltransferase n=1 Tax=Azonexus sp. TaxID=1872668 RepID=UPI0039E656E0
MKEIHSRDNAFYKGLKKLAESARERKKRGLTLLDGLHLVEAWEKQYGALETLIVSHSARQNREILAWLGTRPVTLLSDALLRELGLVETPSGIVAVAPIPQPALQPDYASDALLLDGVQDPGNLGTLLRTAAAAGVRQVLLSPDCAAPWSPKVLRAGQGAHFLLAIHSDADLLAFMKDYQGSTLVTCLEGARSLYETVWPGAAAWIFGAEGQGVRPELIAAAQQRVHIPMPGGTESLNVGAAAAVCLFEQLRRRLLLQP